MRKLPEPLLPNCNEKGRIPFSSYIQWNIYCEMINPIVITIVLLCFSNLFMTFAWYGHLRHLSDKPWMIAAFASWGIALFEYLLQVPANRVGHGVLSIGELKIIQEVITLLIFVPFSVFYMKEKISIDYLWSGVCLMGAVFFLFRSRMGGA